MRPNTAIKIELGPSQSDGVRFYVCSLFVVFSITCT